MMMKREMKRAANRRRWPLSLLTGLLIALLLLSLSACGGGGASADRDAKGKGGEAGAIRIGSKDFTENLILAELYALALEDQGGFKVERKFSLASSSVHQALINDDIDLYPEYTGTGLLSVLQLDMLTDPQQVYDTVKEAYQEQFNLIWLAYSQANDGQGLMVTKEVSDKYGIKTISDLQKHAENIRFASQGEFDEREDGIPALEKVYGPFKFKSSIVIGNALKYDTLLNGEADAAPAYTSEGQLVDDRFVLLTDDKQVWPPYNIAPVVQADTLSASPEIETILDGVNAKIDTPTITGLNAKVDVDKQEYEEVAKAFYDSIKSSL
jgi:osmoprotectant transport system substrate-binding protein